MPVRFATPPAHGESLVRDSLSKLSARQNPLSARGVDFNILQVSQPHAVYDLRADAIVSGGGLASAVFSGYRYLVQREGAVEAAAEVQTDAQGNATTVTHINTGPYVQATAEALTRIAALEPVSKESYEVRLLRSAAIYVMALWLKPESGGADIIYPLPPTPSGLNAEQPYSADGFIQAVLPLARRRSEGRGTDERAVP